MAVHAAEAGHPALPWEGIFGLPRCGSDGPIASHVIRNASGIEIAVTAVATPASYEAAAQHTAFFGPDVPDFLLSEDQAQALREFLRSHLTETVTDGTATYVLRGDRLAYCFPERATSMACGPEAWVDQVAGELQALYELYLQAAEQRAHDNPLQRSVARMSGIGQAALAQFRVHLDAETLAEQFVDDLTRPEGRALLGLHPSVAIDTRVYRAHALQCFSDYRARLDAVPWVPKRGKARERVIVPPPKFDIRPACQWLIERYSGEAGERRRRSEIAKALFSCLQLQNRDNKFEARNGRVELALCFHRASYGDRAVSHGTVVDYQHIRDGLIEVYVERGDPVPKSLADFLPAQCLDANSTYNLGPHIMLRTFVAKAKITLTEAFGDQLREFLATYKLPDE